MLGVGIDVTLFARAARDLAGREAVGGGAQRRTRGFPHRQKVIVARMRFRQHIMGRNHIRN